MTEDEHDAADLPAWIVVAFAACCFAVIVVFLLTI